MVRLRGQKQLIKQYIQFGSFFLSIYKMHRTKKMSVKMGELCVISIFFFLLFQMFL